MYQAEERVGETIFATRNSVKTPKLIAHRGAHMYAPQNSLPAFSIAGEYGVWAIETDVHQTNDGVLVCCHNATTGECYGEDLVIAQTPFPELRKLRLIKGNNLAAFSDDELRMPSFAEYLHICRRAGAVPFLELKADIAGEVIYAVRRAGMEDYTVVSAISFEHLTHTREFSARVFCIIFSAGKNILTRLRIWDTPGCRSIIKNSQRCLPARSKRCTSAGFGSVSVRRTPRMRCAEPLLSVQIMFLPTGYMPYPSKFGETFDVTICEGGRGRREFLEEGERLGALRVRLRGSEHRFDGISCAGYRMT